MPLANGQAIASGNAGSQQTAGGLQGQGVPSGVAIADNNWSGAQTVNGTLSYSTTRAMVEMHGCGGSGGGASGAGVGASAAGGGGPGAYWRKWITGLTPGSAYTVTIGTAGAAPAAGNNNGADGGDVTCLIGGVTYTAKGGGKGTGAATNATGAGGATLAGSSAGDVLVGGRSAGGGVRFSTSAAFGGRGGDGNFGGGGAPVFNADGPAAGAVGAGGAGGCALNATSRAGGAGGDGWARIVEYP